MVGSSLSALALSILSILSEHPMHPYQMRQTAIRRKHDRVITMPAGSFYSTIRRLEADGLITAIGTTREGRRPERTTYEISPQGEELFLHWLRESIAQPAAEHQQFASLIAFFAHLNPSEVVDLLGERLERLDAAHQHQAEMLAEPFWANLPRMFRLHEDYIQTLRQAERDWVAALIDDISSQRLVWAPVIVAWHQRRGTWTEPDTAPPSDDTSPEEFPR